MGSVINAQALFNRVRMWMAGIQFDGRRDLYNEFGWIRNPDYRDFLAAYFRQGMAKRVVDAPVEAMWADPPQLLAQPEFNTAWNGLVEEQSLWWHITRLDKLAGLGRYAAMVVGFDDGADLEPPIRAGNKPRKVIYLQPYHEGSLSVKVYDEDKTSPRFGKPE